MIFRQNRISLLGSVLFITLRAFTYAQEPAPEEIPPGLMGRAVIMEIAARIVEQNQEVIWNAENTKVTIPGRPVELRLVGTNIIVAVQFTPFFRPRGNNFLVAQGQIWIQSPDEGINFYTCMETIPMEFEELIYFFPLGSPEPEEDAQIEIQIVLHPYSLESECTGPGERGRRNKSP